MGNGDAKLNQMVVRKEFSSMGIDSMAKVSVRVRARVRARFRRWWLC